jgi:hypothetical protein
MMTQQNAKGGIQSKFPLIVVLVRIIFESFLPKKPRHFSRAGLM